MRDPRRGGGAGIRNLIRRREFLAAGAALLLWPLARRGRAAGDSEAIVPGLEKALETALETSGFVYVSPLRSDGSESTCHGEVWFAWLDDGVVLITSRDSWKARSLAKGLDRARIWVGDHGRWKRWIGRNEDFRRAPSFTARARTVKDEAQLERLIAVYDEKYPDEIGTWRRRFREGYADGSRVLIRYEHAG